MLPDGAARFDQALAAVMLDFRAARPLPKPAFVDPSFFELDVSLFARSWLPVAHASEVELPGAFSVTELGGERVVVVRDETLSLAAFLDGCLHRGTPLFDRSSGRLPELGITCPYHGLRYDLRGRAQVASCPAIRLGEKKALTAVRVAERLGFVFVCLRDDAPGIDDYFGQIPPWLTRASMFALRLARRSIHTVACNWKLCVQNFQESHHFKLVHPSLEAATPAHTSTSVTFDGAFLGGTMAIADGRATVSDEPLRARPFVAGPDDRRTVYDALLVPGWMTSLQPDYFLSYRLLPRSAIETTVVADIYFHASAFSEAFQPNDVFAFWDRTNAEDRSICERQQRGLGSPSFEPGPYADVEDGVHAFDRRLAMVYREELSKVGAQ